MGEETGVKASINDQRLRETFLALVGHNSPSGQEREILRYCEGLLRDAGFLGRFDAAGNLIAQKAGTVADAPRIFLNAHVDTVQPTAGLQVREVDGVFRTDGTTILGADDKAGVAQILETVLALEEAQEPHGDLVVILTTREEVGLEGAKALEPAAIAGCIGFVFDSSGPPGAMVVQSPAQDSLHVRIRGRAAHAGVQPEKGISALQIAARAIDRMPQGRIDAETTANVGTIHGGTATNVVAEECLVTLEARSRNPESLERQVATMRRCFEEAATEFGGQVEIRIRREYSGYSCVEDAPPVRWASEAWRRLTGGEVERRATGGGSDANIFNGLGVPTVVLSVGYLGHHTTGEYLPIADLELGARWCLEIVRTAREARH